MTSVETAWGQKTSDRIMDEKLVVKELKEKKLVGLKSILIELTGSDSLLEAN